MLFLAFLFQILGRLFIFVLFSYSFGPGNYYPILIFLGAHIILMSTLHFIFSDAKVYWQKGEILTLFQLYPLLYLQILAILALLTCVLDRGFSIFGNFRLFMIQ